MVQASSLFDALVEGPPDPILNTLVLYRADPNPNKVNLGIGAYRTDEGRPCVFPTVKRVQEVLLAKETDKEYLPIDGIFELKKLTQALIFGSDFAAVTEQRIASVQAISGTGGLRVAAEFIGTQGISSRRVYISNPTWENHRNIFSAAGFTVESYTYWDPISRGLDFARMLSDLRSATPGSVVVLHACAHNPTGVDPTPEQWQEILKVVQEKKLIPLFDSAYQGYASGDLDKDAYAIRLFAQSGLEMFVTQSFAKNMGLYGERVGMLHVVCSSSEKAKIVLSQLKPVIRRMYSSPPSWGARIATEILGDPNNASAWKSELKAISARINRVRIELRDGLIAKGTPGNWDHVAQQIGMFSYTGLRVEQCERLMSKWHVYLLKTGRISLAGLNANNMEYVINAIDDCVRNTCESNL